MTEERLERLTKGDLKRAEGFAGLPGIALEGLAASTQALIADGHQWIKKLVEECRLVDSERITALNEQRRQTELRVQAAQARDDAERALTDRLAELAMAAERLAERDNWRAELAQRVGLPATSPWGNLRTVVLGLWDKANSVNEQAAQARDEVSAANADRNAQAEAAQRLRGEQSQLIERVNAWRAAYDRWWSGEPPGWPTRDPYASDVPAQLPYWGPAPGMAPDQLMASAPPRSADPEVEAMAYVYQKLAGLDQPAQDAALSWVGRRLERDRQNRR